MKLFFFFYDVPPTIPSIDEARTTGEKRGSLYLACVSRQACLGLSADLPGILDDLVLAQFPLGFGTKKSTAYQAGNGRGRSLHMNNEEPRHFLYTAAR